jgi:trk system potassium uptake protein
MQQLTTERLNRLLYNSKDRVYSLLRIVTYITSTVAACLLVYSYGFNLSSVETSRIFSYINLVYVAFIIIYLIRLLYSFQRRAFIRRTSTEAVIFLLLVVNGFINHVLGVNLLYEVSLWLGIKNYNAFHEIISTVFLITLIGLEVSKASTRLPLNRLKPSTLFIGSFIVLISVGSGLLMLPAMTNTPTGMPLINAIFTATSAACVTGLIVVDTATYFTHKGQLIILTLIQIGGIGMLSFTTFFATLLKQGVGIKHQSAIQDFLSSESLFSSRGLLQQIVLLTLLLEGAGALAIFITWGPEVQFENLGEKIFFSIFHAVSAFCNAGFSLYTNGLYEAPVRQSYILHIVVAGIIIFGGLGFSPIMDILSPRALRERLAMPWKDWKLNTKLAIYTAMVLNIFGMALYYLLESDNTLTGMNILESLITSFFQSVTLRTAGFNTVDFTKLENPTMIMMMFLMFIGASPGSTGGGIKTITFLLIAVSVISTIRGKKIISIDKRTIPMETLFKAYSVITFAAAYIFLGVFILSITEPEQESIDLLFEQVSAFATVGLSTGVTPQLSVIGKTVIIATMFIGRVGTVTLAIALSRPVISNAYRYPDAHLMVG